MIRIVALIERYYHCKSFVYMRDGQDYKVMNETFGERQLRREHLRIIIAAPQPSIFFASSVCLAQTRIVAFRSEESSRLPSKVSRLKTPLGYLYKLCMCLQNTNSHKESNSLHFFSFLFL